MIRDFWIAIAVLLVFFISQELLYSQVERTIIGEADWHWAIGDQPINRVSIRDSSGNIHVIYGNGRLAPPPRPGIDGGDVYHIVGSPDGLYWSDTLNISKTPAMPSVLPSLAIDRWERLHVVWMEAGNDSDNYYEVFYSIKDSCCWSAPVNVSNQFGRSNTSPYPSLAVDSNGRPHVVWDQWVGPGDWDIFYSAPTDTGWLEPERLSFDIYDSAFPTIVIDSQDRVYVFWRTRQESDNRVIAYRVLEDGTWSPLTIAVDFSMANEQVSAVIGNNDMPILCFTHTSIEGQSDIFIIRLDDAGWSEPEKVSESDRVASYGNFSIDTAENLYVVWMVGGDSMHYQDIYYRMWDGSEWSMVVNLSDDTTHTEHPKIGYPVTEWGVDLLWLSVENFDYNNNGIEDALVNYSNLDSALIGVIPEEARVIPITHSLYQNFPNPFNAKTDIRYLLINQGNIELTIYDMLGHEVSRLIDGEQRAGEYLFTWNTEGVASGIYFYTLKVNSSHGDFVQTRKMVLLK